MYLSISVWFSNYVNCLWEHLNRYEVIRLASNRDGLEASRLEELFELYHSVEHLLLSLVPFTFIALLAANILDAYNVVQCI